MTLEAGKSEEQKKYDEAIKLATKYWPDEMTMATCTKKAFNEFKNYPDDMKRKLAEYDYKNLHYVIYIK